jgi:hypothetical protein
MRTRAREHVPSSSAASRRRGASLLGVALFAAWVAGPVGCGEDEVCTPGAQVACACGGGEEGAQACNAEGTALGECDCSNVTGSGAAGPGSGAAGPGPGGSGPASSAGPGGQGSGGSAVCDGKGVCEDSDDDNSNDCVGCALDGTCGPAIQACAASEPCANYIVCLDGCGQTPRCVEGCNTSQPTGKTAFDDILASCVCAQCETDCASSYFCQ